jgi:hypothetical protein
MIRHAGPPRLAVRGLPISMIRATFRGLLMLLVVAATRLATVPDPAVVGAEHWTSVAEALEANNEPHLASTALATDGHDHDALRREVGAVKLAVMVKPSQRALVGAPLSTTRRLGGNRAFILLSVYDPLAGDRGAGRR